jgi:hypothetical protein
MCSHFYTRGVGVKHSVSTIFCTQKLNGTFKCVQFFVLDGFDKVRKTPVAVNRLMFPNMLYMINIMV